MKDILRVRGWNDVFPTGVAVDFRIQPDGFLSPTRTGCADIDGYKWMRLFKCVTLQNATPATSPVESSPGDGILQDKKTVYAALFSRT